jgi:serine/threonine protein kinase
MVPVSYVEITSRDHVKQVKYPDFSKIAPDNKIEYTNLFLSESLGTGGCASVWKAKLKLKNKESFVAVKMLSNEETRESIISTHQQEIESLSKLRHPNIVVLLGYTQASQTQAPLIVLEWMERGDLSHQLGKRKNKSIFLPWPVRINIAIHIMEGLMFLHSHGVIHRDIKSDNVLLCEMEGDPFFAKLADFGLAHHRESSLSQAGTYVSDKAVGTQEYRSPELLIERRYHWYTDIYALALVLWELLTHRMSTDLQTHSQKRKFIEAENDKKREHPEFWGLIEKGWISEAHDRITVKSLKEELRKLKEEKYPDESSQAAVHPSGQAALIIGNNSIIQEPNQSRRGVEAVYNSHIVCSKKFATKISK